LQCVAVCCSVLQCVAVCCSVLQCVAVCCSVSQCVAVSTTAFRDNMACPTTPCQKRHIKRDVIASKEMSLHQKRCHYIIRNQYRSNETYITQKRPRNCLVARYTCQKDMSKEMSILQKKPIPIKWTIYHSKETQKLSCGTIHMSKRYVKRDVYAYKKKWLHQKIDINPKKTYINVKRTRTCSAARYTRQKDMSKNRYQSKKELYQCEENQNIFCGTIHTRQKDMSKKT